MIKAKFVYITALTLLISLVSNIDISKAQTSMITGVPGYTNAFFNTGTNQYDINPTFFVNGGTVALNRFSQFSLSSSDTANMYLSNGTNYANTVINIVNYTGGTPSQINGTLNVRYGTTNSAPVAGNMIFVDPNGIFVGSGGVINAGAILLSTSQNTIGTLSSGTYPTIDLNDQSQDSRLTTQNLVVNGLWNFNNISGGLNIRGTLNTNFTNTSPIAHPGILLIGNTIDVSGTLNNHNFGYVGLLTGGSAYWNDSSSTYVYADTTAPASVNGDMGISGTIVNQSGGTYIKADTTDVTNNCINFTGLINASAITTNTTGGYVSITIPNEGLSTGLIGLTFDGTGGTPTSPRGHIIANSTGTNSGSTVLIQAPSVRIQSGGGIQVQNGPNTTTGGTVQIQHSTGSNVASIGSTTSSFLDANTLPSIITADGSVSTSARGTLRILGNSSAPGLNINSCSYSTSSYTNALYDAAGGNVNINNSYVAAYGDLNFNGNGFLITSSTLRTTNGSLHMISNNGIITEGAFSDISADTGNLYFLRNNTTSSMYLTSQGTLEANGGTGIIHVGNDNSITNSQSVILAGSTFGPYANTYTASQTIPISPTTTLNAGTLNIAISNTPPPPPPPPPPPNPTNPDNSTNPNPVNPIIFEEFKREVTIDTQRDVAIAVTNSTNTQINMYQPQNNPFNKQASDNSQSSITLDQGLKNCKGGNCDQLLSSDSPGGRVIGVLFGGYPSENEFTADNLGVTFSNKSNYYPEGLETFLNSLKKIEKSATTGNQGTSASSLFSYKHPPTDTRIKKINTELKNKMFQDNTQKIRNKKHFENIINSIE